MRVYILLLLCIVLCEHVILAQPNGPPKGDGPPNGNGKKSGEDGERKGSGKPSREAKRPKRRDIGFSSQGSKGSLVSRNNDGEGKRDGMDIDIHGRPPFGEVRFKYLFAPKADNTTRTKSMTTFSLKILDIVEFWPQDISKGFQVGVDVPLSSYPRLVGKPGREAPSSNGAGRSHFDWKDIELIEQTENITTFALETVDSVLRLVAHATAVENGTLSPNAVKFDIIVSNFNFTQSNSTLALRTRLDSDTKTKDAPKPPPTGEVGEVNEVGEEYVDMDQDGLTIDMEDEEDPEAPVGRFTWVSNVDIDGVEVNVIPSKRQVDGNDEKNKFVFFTFNYTNSFSNMTWDPEVGVSYTEPTDSEGGESTPTESPSVNGGAIRTAPIWFMAIVAGVIAQF